MFVSAVNIILYSNYLTAKYKQEVSSLQTKARVSVELQNFQEEDSEITFVA
jgi:hypothetical protein